MPLKIIPVWRLRLLFVLTLWMRSCVTTACLLRDRLDNDKHRHRPQHYDNNMTAIRKKWETSLWLYTWVVINRWQLSRIGSQRNALGRDFFNSPIQLTCTDTRWVPWAPGTDCGPIGDYTLTDSRRAGWSRVPSVPWPPASVSARGHQWTLSLSLLGAEVGPHGSCVLLESPHPAQLEHGERREQTAPHSYTLQYHSVVTTQ